MKLKYLFQKKKQPLDKSGLLRALFEKKQENQTTENKSDVDFLVDIVNVFRPDEKEINSEIDLTPFLNLLNENDDYKSLFVNYLNELLYKKDLDQIITDTGIIKDTDFIYEVRKRFIEKLLPDQPAKDTLQFVLNQVFYSSNDPIWLEKIPQNQVDDVFNLCEFNTLYKEGKNNFVLSELFYGLEVLVQRITGRVMETDVNKMVPEYQNFDSPFIALQREFSDLNESLMLADKKYLSTNDLIFKQIILLHKQCENYVDVAFNNSHKYGISLKVNQSLLRIRQQLERIKELLPFLVLDTPSEVKTKTIDFTFLLIKYNCNKSNVKKLIGESTQLLSYEITQHTAQTGEHYITKTRKEYFKMLRTASGGGLIVAFLCVFKVLLGKIETSDLGHAFLYSMNYSIGFISIYLFGCTLATKQPAMTASALVSAIEQGTKETNKNNTDKYRNFAIFFARVFRSQFIAFFGNVMVAFPVALFLIWGIDKLFHYNIAETKWFHLVNDLSPISSPAIFHAAIAGFFLFISGIIAGSIANR